MLDTSGLPLHKRGYRTEAGVAPIRETLAAALVKIARPREDVRFWDPFCGSATIPLEAALLMTNTAPGLNRPFAAEKYAFLDKGFGCGQGKKQTRRLFATVLSPRLHRISTGMS